METKHTKGEWRQQEGLSLTGLRRVLTNEKTVCEIYATNFNSDEEFEANAKLIASAPDLLEALNNITNEVEKMCSIGSDPLFMNMLQYWQDAKLAIKKATE